MPKFPYTELLLYLIAAFKEYSISSSSIFFLLFPIDLFLESYSTVGEGGGKGRGGGASVSWDNLQTLRTSDAPVHCKKKVSNFPVPSLDFNDHWPIPSWPVIIKLFPARGVSSLVSDIPAGDGKIANLFYSVHLNVTTSTRGRFCFDPRSFSHETPIREPLDKIGPIIKKLTSHF